MQPSLATTGGPLIVITRPYAQRSISEIVSTIPTGLELNISVDGAHPDSRRGLYCGRTRTVSGPASARIASTTSFSSWIAGTRATRYLK